MTGKEGSKVEIPNYEVIVSLKNEKYLCRIPELSLVVKGNDLESCYQELMEKKEELIAEIEEFKGRGALTPPSTSWFREGKELRGAPNAGDDFRGFLKKTLFVGFIVLIVFNIATQTIGREINELAKNMQKEINELAKNVQKEIKNQLPSHPGRKIENELYKAADNPIDPEREQKIVESVRVIVSRLKPIAKELRPLLEEVGLAKEK